MNALQRLQQAYPKGEARALYELIMETRFALTRTDLLLGKDTTLSATDQAELAEIVERVANREPVQYVLGHETFCGHAFRVAPGVLIPRPETQQLVRLVRQQMPARSRILDIGTGSGCIAVTLALSGYGVTAFDISPEALAIARQNAADLSAEVQFRQEDILSPTATDECWDAIVSNPPYICRSEANQMEDNVLRHEPHLALFVPDEDPLLFYRAIAAYGQTHLADGGSLFFEINRAYARQTSDMLLQQGYAGVETIKDQYDNDRFVCARKKQHP